MKYFLCIHTITTIFCIAVDIDDNDSIQRLLFPNKENQDTIEPPQCSMTLAFVQESKHTQISSQIIPIEVQVWKFELADIRGKNWWQIYPKTLIRQRAISDSVMFKIMIINASSTYIVQYVPPYYKYANNIQIRRAPVAYVYWCFSTSHEKKTFNDPIFITK